MVRKKKRVQELLDSVFTWPGPLCLGLNFFQGTEIGKSSLSNFLKFLRTRVLDTH